MRFISIGAALAATAVLASWPAPAGATALNTIDRGWYVDTDSFQRHDYHEPGNDNYITGQVGRSDYHDFFTFDLTGVTGTITNATLHLFEPSGTNFASGGFVTTQASETFQVFTYGGNISTLDAGGQVPGVYNGLVSGTLAGSVSVSAANGGTFVDISLNAAALAALNIGEGGLFAFGGDLLGVPDGQLTQRTVFANSSVDDVGAPDGNTQLILTTSSSTPIPGALPLFVSGLGAFGFLGWRRKKTGQMNSKIRGAISAVIMTIAFLSAQPVSTARSAALLQFEEVGGDVVGSLSGSLNVTGLPQASCLCTFPAFLTPALGFVITSSFSDLERQYPVTGPSSVGPGTIPELASSTTASLVDLDGSDHFLGLPATYFGGPLTGAVTFAGQTFGTLGLQRGDYVYSLSNGDTYTVSVGGTPLPAALPLFATGLGGLGLFGWRRKKKAALAV